MPAESTRGFAPPTPSAGAQHILRHSCDGGGNYGLRYFRCHATFFTIPKYSQELLRPRELGRRIHSLFPRASAVDTPGHADIHVTQNVQHILLISVIG